MSMTVLCGARVRGAVHLAKRLVVPPVGAGVGERFFAYDFQGLVKDIKSGFVRKAFDIGHRPSTSRFLIIYQQEP